MNKRSHATLGFTLTEMAIVLVIVSLLIGGLLVPFGAQDDSRRVAETQKTMSEIRDALLGYAAANRRLPCPASSTSNGIEDPVGGGTCNHPYDGFVPAVTLGITSTSSSGYVIDPWAQSIRYALAPATANAVTNVFSSVDGIKTATLSNMSSATPLLSVCNTGSGVTNAGTSTAACSSSSTTLTSTAVAVIYSLGKNYATGGTGTDEKQNPNPNTASPAADPLFVYHEPAPSSATNGEFDDVMIWLSPNILYNRMIAAGQLP